MPDIADEPPTPEASHAFLKDDNEKRINAMRERTGGKVELNGAFESMRATTYLKHLLLEYGLLDRADLDFEGQRSSALDKIEGEVDEHEEKMASALRQGKLMGERRGHVQGAAGPRLVR